jgi:hypothetical protein
MNRKWIVGFFGGVALAVATNAQATVPQTFSVQGVLRDKSGNLIGATVSTTKNVIVNFYSTKDATTTFYSTPVTQVGVTGGLFTVKVDVSGLNATQKTAFATPPLFLEVVAGDDTFPRQEVTPDVYALMCSSADSLTSACAGCVTDSMIGGISAGKISNSGVEPVFLLPAQGDPSGNGLQNGFTNYGNGHILAGYYKDPFGIVHLQGLLVPPSSIPNNTAIFKLKPGYQPGLALELGVSSYTSGTALTLCEIEIFGDGTVNANSSCGTRWISLDSITFRAAQ